MARLVSYKPRDENRYSTFGGEMSYTSNENLTEKYRARLLPKKGSKLKNKKSKNGNQVAETMPTISSSIEMHRNKIAQSQTVNAPSGGGAITRARRRSNRSSGTQSRFRCCFSGAFCAQKCNWRCNQNCCANCSWWKWCCKRKCCARLCCGCIDCADSGNDDDDIDAKFEQYKYEMRLNDLRRGDANTTNKSQETSLQSNSSRIETTPVPCHQQKASTSNDGSAINSISTADKVSAAPATKSRIFRYRKYWNWNDSLRSNSDKFLETLEYDMDGEQSLNRANNKYKQNDNSVHTKG